jgi:hypothetical protein
MMLKKLTWIYLAIYVVAVTAIVIVGNAQMKEPLLSTTVWGIVFFLLPAIPVALENYGKKCPFVFTLLAFLLVLVMFLGTINFNTFELRTILQTLLFAVLLGLLGYSGITRLQKNKVSK